METCVESLRNLSGSKNWKPTQPQWMFPGLQEQWRSLVGSAWARSHLMAIVEKSAAMRKVKNNLCHFIPFPLANKPLLSFFYIPETYGKASGNPKYCPCMHGAHSSERGKKINEYNLDNGQYRCSDSDDYGSVLQVLREKNKKVWYQQSSSSVWFISPKISHCYWP